MDEPFTLVIGNCNYSSWSLRGWIALRHAGVEFDEIRIPLDTDEFQRRIAEYSPTRQVPVLIHGQRRVWDSLAIGEYLAELVPEARLWPDARDARAHARAVACEMHAGFAALRRALPMNCRARGRAVTPDAATRRDLERISRIWRECLRTASGGSWLFGHFTIADAMYVPVASRLRTYALELDPVVAEYVATVHSDPHMQEWVHRAEAEPWVIEREEAGAPARG